jgi:uncharacterized lipoprotein YddW (UPF0748 family)
MEKYFSFTKELKNFNPFLKSFIKQIALFHRLLAPNRNLMRKYFLTVLTTLLLFNYSSAQVKQELRAAWLTNVDSNVLFTDQSISEALDYLASAGFNVVFPVVYNKGYTLYPSKVMQNLFNAPVLPNSAFINRDFLERLTIEAHRVGIEVIPWFEFGFSTSYSLNGGHILAKFPQWALKDRDGKLVVDNGFDWMSAINPNAQNFILSLMTEVIDNYDIDGVQGDDRLPAMPVEGGYDSTTVAIYKSENNGAAPPTDYFNTSWMRWRADKMNQFQKRLRDSVKVRGANIIFSSSPTPYYWGYRELLQDSKTWALQGLVDNIVPQLYQYNLSDYNYALNTTWNDYASQTSKIFTPGILMKVGSYVADTTFLGQMLMANRTKGAKGESFFFYEGIRANNNAIGKYLKRNFYTSAAIPPYRNGNVWRPKGIIVNETDPNSTKTGNWGSYLMKGYEGAILRTSDISQPATMTYSFQVQTSGYYDVYDYRVPNIPWAKQARYTLYSQKDSSTVTVDQSDIGKKGWYKLGKVYLTAGINKVVKLDNSLLKSGEYLITDAIMLLLNRKLSPEVQVGINKKDESEELNTSFKIYSNYPNPFNPSTTISWTNSKTERITIKIFDLLGKEITTLLDDIRPSGHNSIVFNGENLSSGVYFYTLSSSEYFRIMKMLLVK